MKTIFLIDDDPDDREIFEEALASLQLPVLFQYAGNVQEAFDKLKNENFIKPDLIFLDLNMPIMDGRTFLIKIKQDVSLWDAPVVIYSTSSSDADKKFAEENKAALFMTKQYSMDQIRSEIKQVLSKLLNL